MAKREGELNGWQEHEGSVSWRHRSADRTGRHGKCSETMGILSFIIPRELDVWHGRDSLQRRFGEVDVACFPRALVQRFLMAFPFCSDNVVSDPAGVEQGTAKE